MVEAIPGKRAGSDTGFVLIVDSDPQNLFFLSMIIQHLGYKTSSALGVGKALEIASDAAPSLVISELNLKGLSGLDLLDRLEQSPGARPVPVIIMTRELTPGLELQCRRAGAVACLEKPIQANALFQAIDPIMAPGSRRKDLRIRTRLSVTVDDRPLDCVDGECATNLSVNGMYLRTLRSYPVNSEVLVQATLNGQEIEAKARVVYSHGAGAGQSGLRGIGLQFLETSPQAAEIIRRFINDEAAHGIEPDTV
jgi:CheY-like chemotaxis protein/Tfp pilus assembly protein PilZ